jgi:hypothetical protein
MAAGDFIEAYGGEDAAGNVSFCCLISIHEWFKLKWIRMLLMSKGRWDCVVTCFFIDTAKNIVEYLDIIRNALTPDGIWINLGKQQEEVLYIYVTDNYCALKDQRSGTGRTTLPRRTSRSS